MTRRPIRVVIVDDSLVAREMLRQILTSDPDIEIVGVARDGAEGSQMVGQLKPDLVTMDIHMPKMDGLRATEAIMAFDPTPILVVSSSVHGEGIGRAFDALSAGALEVMKKPEPRDWAELQTIGTDVIRKVKILSRVKVITHVRGLMGEKTHVPVPPPRPEARGLRAVAIGSSTGGPSALQTILSVMPKEFPLPVIVAQHIADGFVPGMVHWLGTSTGMRVTEVVDGERVEPGVVYFSPTGTNIRFDGIRIRFSEPSPGQLYVPCADTLLESVAASCRADAIGVILTGMGSDGAIGMRKMSEAGAMTIAQDEGSSVVFGMPKAAADAGAVSRVLPLDRIGPELLGLLAG